MDETRLAPGYEADFQEYDTEKTINKYRRATAGEGISYLLPNSYGPVFLAAARDALHDTGTKALRIVEFGCGAGMAIHYLVDALQDEGIDVELAVGADFVPRMVETANHELERLGGRWAKDRLRYVVATNERLGVELADSLGQP